MGGRVDVVRGEFWPLVFALGTALWLLLSPTFGYPALAAQEAGLVLFGAIVGYAVGGYRVTLTAACLARRCKATPEDIERIARQDFSEGTFLSVTSAMTLLYVVTYEYSASRAAVVAGQWPVPLPVVGITAATIGALTFFSMRYAIYNRLSGLLEHSLAQWPDGKPLVIEKLRDAVFRDSHIFEPPGNIFVTVGITATFLGLAFALLTLDLPGLLGGGEGSTPASPNALVSRLTAFTGCMGLALGVSMLGVVTAMCAQRLRGAGSRTDTDHLLASADAAIANGRAGRAHG